MKITVINGNPKGKVNNTNIMVTAFLKGAQEAGAETLNIFWVEKEFKSCSAYHPYWFHHPEQNVTRDDVAEILTLGVATNIIVLATPIYFENISSIFNVFMDRLTMISSLHSANHIPTEEQSMATSKMQSPKLMIISSCGLAGRSGNQFISQWIKRIALKMHTEVIAEIHAGQGRFVMDPTDELQPFIPKYLDLLGKAGKEIALTMNLSAATKYLLENNLMPEYAFNVTRKKAKGLKPYIL